MIQIEQIIAVSSKSTLFKLVTSRANGLILEDLTNGKTNFFSSRTFQFSPLESIGIYTLSDNIPLKEVYKRFLEKASTDPIPGADSTDPEYKSYFESIIPEYDRYRVHVRDMRKCVKWFHQLQSLGYINLLEGPSKEEEEELAKI